MKKLLNRISRFFFPPADAARWVRLLPFAFLGVLTLIVLLAGAYVWDYTNSPAFCGTTCHTMPPEYSAYQASPHARVDCVDCHIGKDFITTRITRKAGDIRHVIATVLKDYEYPLHTKSLRPARETCERCHNPEKFSDDTFMDITHFKPDKDNTPTSTYVSLKTGGGAARAGLGRGIHWHIEQPVYYYATDENEQDIPYVRTVGQDGKVTEYRSIDARVDPSQIQPSQLKQMDCITCHNRITHLVKTPENQVDDLLARGPISRAIPEIRKKAVEVYNLSYQTSSTAHNSIAGLANYYKQYYPDYFAGHEKDIQQAIQVLQETYRSNVYPEQKSDWNAHPNNVGHKDFPGCFRCHDGKHLDAAQQAIPMECNLCHSIPKVAGLNDFLVNIEINRGQEPQSHLNSNWIGQHRDAMDSTCANCHDTKNPGGTDNSSFCSNSACHGNKWTFAGLDAPGLREILVKQLPPTPTPAPLPAGGALTWNDTLGPLLAQQCTGCHGATGIKGLNLTNYADAMKGSESGPVIQPGKAQESLIVKKQSDRLPHFSQLNQDNLQLLIDWINAGAPEQ